MIFPKHIFLCSDFVCKNPKTIHHPKALSKNFDGIQFEFANVVFKVNSLKHIFEQTLYYIFMSQPSGM